MGKLRFPNPGSDIERMASVFTLIASKATERETFDLDFMTDILTANGQASSQGAQGAQAVARSRREDRSRDPLYNQLKMYSEIYRMFGWIRPTTESRLTFRTTLLGETVAFDAKNDRARLSALIQQSVTTIVFPNTTTENLGVISQRPFSWLLRLAAQLDRVITRHEIIIGLLAKTDDTQEHGIQATVEEIRRLRKGPFQGLLDRVDSFAARENVQRNTLENYTRFPVGVMCSPLIGWGTPGKVTGLYSDGKQREAVRLSDKGLSRAEEIAQMIDVRLFSIEQFSLDERAAFASLTYYQLLNRAGFKEAGVLEGLREYERLASPIMRHVGANSPGLILFSPFIQETDEVITRALEGV